jgi:spore coat polysaccharide biosynthesis protein SpsF (cytidylyltransferase family)
MEMLFLIQARLGSTRYPRKMLENIYKNFNLIEIIVERLMMSNFCNKNNLYVLTTDSETDNDLIEDLKNKCVKYYRGNEDNVYKRFCDFVEYYELKHGNKVDLIIRICGDNPFIEPAFIDSLIDEYQEEIDYYSYEDKLRNPAILTHYGFFGEVIKKDTLVNSKYLVNKDYLREHVTPIFYKNNKFKTKYLQIPLEIQEMDIRLTFDTKEDLFIIKKIFSDLNKLDYNYKEVLNNLNSNTNLLEKMKTNILNNSKTEQV